MTNTEKFMHALRSKYSLDLKDSKDESRKYVLADPSRSEGYMIGTYTASPQNRPNNYVSGYELVERIEWAENEIKHIQQARDNMVALLREQMDSAEGNSTEDCPAHEAKRKLSEGVPLTIADALSDNNPSNKD